MSEHGKITEVHRRRRAVVYVRQSSVGQVERNVESAARQYALRERAIELGWPAGSVAVVDEDTGRSGASSDGRLGFKELVAEVGLGHVGLILALETSRLARCSADWHRLLDLCALTGTLIADGDGVYSPADFNDRLLLGLKGTMSEAELHLIRARLVGGLRNKAKRGELRLRAAGRPGSRRRRPDRALPGRAGPPRDRARVLPVAAAGLGASGRDRADRRGPAVAAAHGRAAADPLGSRELWRGARPPDQPGVCRRVRVRPPAPGEAPRRARRGARPPR